MGVEIAAQLPDVATVYVAAGGGGMLSGIGAVLGRRRAPRVEVVGCWPEAAPDACCGASRRASRSTWPSGRRISDGTAGGLEPGAITPALAGRVMGRGLEVSEAAIAEAMRTLLASDRWLVEGAAGVALAAALADPAPARAGRSSWCCAGATWARRSRRACSRAAERAPGRPVAAVAPAPGPFVTPRGRPRHRARSGSVRSVSIHR